MITGTFLVTELLLCPGSGTCPILEELPSSLGGPSDYPIRSRAHREAKSYVCILEREAKLGSKATLCGRSPCSQHLFWASSGSCWKPTSSLLLVQAWPCKPSSRFRVQVITNSRTRQGDLGRCKASASSLGRGPVLRTVRKRRTRLGDATQCSLQLFLSLSFLLGG